MESAGELATTTEWRKFWLPVEKEGSWFGRHKVLTGVGGGLAAVLLIGLVASVGSDPTPVTGGPASPTTSPTVTEPATVPSKNVPYGSVIQLRDPVTEAGYACPNWEQDDALKFADESGTCSDEDVLSTYATAADLEAQTQLITSLPEGLQGSAILAGPNWMLNLPSEWVYRVKEAIGGEVERA